MSNSIGKNIVPQKNIVLMGTISDRIDYELLYKFSQKFENYTLKIIGKIIKNNFSEKNNYFFNKLNRQSNVIFTDEKHFEELQNEINDARLCLCCYKDNLISSLKIMQYIALGKAVISTYMIEFDTPEMKEIVCITKSHAEFLEMAELQLAVEDPLELKQKRIKYASKFTYSKLIAIIEKKIESVINLKNKYDEN